MSAPIDPGTPEARRAWLDSLPVGAVVVDASGGTNERVDDGWRDSGGVMVDDEMSTWCADGAFWPATIPTPPLPFACPADWTPPQPVEVRAMLDGAGLTQVEAARSLGMSRSAVAKWLSGEMRIGWPAWRVLVALAGEGRDGFA